MSKTSTVLSIAALIISGGALASSFYLFGTLKSEMKGEWAERKAFESNHGPDIIAVMSQVQHHFADLHFAAQAGNWGLAEHKIDEVEAALNRAPLVLPVENNVNLAELITMLARSSLTDMRTAAKAGNAADFTKAFNATISSCNACHLQTDHPDIQVGTPTAPGSTTVLFEPRKDP